MVREVLRERIEADEWEEFEGHLARYRYAASRTLPGEVVIDVACGIGYGATFFDETIEYHGYDRPGVHGGFRGVFHGCDLDDPKWFPMRCDVVCCFETIEHVRDPWLLATKLDLVARRAIFVSAPTVPTTHFNPFHLHDFSVDDIPPMFRNFKVVDCWQQPEELSHVWHLSR